MTCLVDRGGVGTNVCSTAKVALVAYNMGGHFSTTVILKVYHSNQQQHYQYLKSYLS